VKRSRAGGFVPVIKAGIRRENHRGPESSTPIGETKERQCGAGTPSRKKLNRTSSAEDDTKDG